MLGLGMEVVSHQTMMGRNQMALTRQGGGGRCPSGLENTDAPALSTGTQFQQFHFFNCCLFTETL